MSSPLDLTNWISAVFTAIAAFATFASVVISWFLFKLQKGQLKIQETQAKIQAAQLRLEESSADQKKPFVHIWSDNHRPIHDINSEGVIGKTFTLINIGGSPLPIRTIRIFDNSLAKITAIRLSAGYIFNGKEITVDNSISPYQLFDIIFVPNEIWTIKVYLDTSQVRFEITHYDNSTELIDIDTAVCGPYVITGKGKKI
ncbi:MAG: hypothetical protein V4591_09530 [Bdellovibrionota bacterium]